MSALGDDFATAVEIIPGRFYFAWVKRPECLRSSHVAAGGITYCIDDTLLYEPFFADFGPLNLGRTFRFCRQTNELLQEADRLKKRLYFYTGPHAHHKANAAVLVGIYQVLFLNRTAEEAYKPLLSYKPYVPFRDASCGVSTFHLTVFDVIKGIQKARDVGFIDWNSGNSTWSLEEYEHFEQVENGDLNWILPGKLVAFSGPAARGNEIAGYRLYTPEDYWDYYRKKGVTAVVRLNKKVYDRKRFTDGGFRHYDLYFPDGSCPPDSILMKFLELAENEPGAVAIHCKAGLGRTGVLICSFLMKHYRFTAEEVIGYIRVCRPGSVIGPQQNYLREVEARMWHEGDLYRQQRGMKSMSPGMQDLSINGKSAAGHEEAVGAAGGYMASALTGGMKGGLYSRQRSESMNSAVSAADLSLLQYKSMMYGSAAAPAASTPLSSAVTPSSNARRYAGRSITPLRYGGGLQSGYGMVSQSHPQPPTAPAAQRSSSVVNKSVPTMGISGGGRAPSADRALSDRINGSSLRATLHTDTLRAADRPKVIPERNTQSADVSSNSSSPSAWKVSSTPSLVQGTGIAQPKVSGGQRPGMQAGVARVLAPNGQPRKIPVGLLGQYQSQYQQTPVPGQVRPSSIASSGMSIQPDHSRIKSVAQLRYGLHSK